MKKRFEAWDGRIAADSWPAAIFEIFLAWMAKSVAEAKAPKAWEWVVGKGPSILNPFGFFGYRRMAT